MATAILIRMRGAQSSLEIELREKVDSIVVHLAGFATAAHIDKAIEIFGVALNLEKSIAVELSQTVALDPRFFGLLLMTRKRLRQRGQKLRFLGASPKITRAFRWSGFDYLLSE
jgi:N-acetylglucosaminyldiphosphoundecaprenol N-acetyl-beta-D-mannosaminyltransferase